MCPCKGNGEGDSSRTEVDQSSATIASFAQKWNVQVVVQGFWVGAQLVPLREQWFITKKIIVAHLKETAYREVRERRPWLYEGLANPNEKAHRKLLCSLHSLDQNLLVKIWTGSIMTRAKANQMDRGDAECRCGHDRQTLAHLLWSCPCFPPPNDLLHLSLLPAFRSVAHILPRDATPGDVRDWKASCKRAIAIFKTLDKPRNATGEEVPTIVLEARGHCLRVLKNGTYVFCGKCFISRRMRDYKWIFLRDCAFVDRTATSLGARETCEGHQAVLDILTWKNSAQRPAWRCERCDITWWATARPKRFCPEADAWTHLYPSLPSLLQRHDTLQQVLSCRYYMKARMSHHECFALLTLHVGFPACAVHSLRLEEGMLEARVSMYTHLSIYPYGFPHSWVVVVSMNCVADFGQVDNSFPRCMQAMSPFRSQLPLLSLSHSLYSIIEVLALPYVRHSVPPCEVEPQCNTYFWNRMVLALYERLFVAAA